MESKDEKISDGSSNHFSSHTALGEDTMKNNATEISKHYAAEPSLYELDKTPKEELSDKITRQYLMVHKP